MKGKQVERSKFQPLAFSPDASASALQYNLQTWATPRCANRPLTKEELKEGGQFWTCSDGDDYAV
ncbi:MAG: hypothetical protein AB1589_20500 [Cyanobacteriota bacterium]